MARLRTCPRCGAPAKDSERACSICGAALPEQAQATSGATTGAPSSSGDPTQPAGPGGDGLPPVTASASAPQPRRRPPLWALIVLGLVGLFALGGAGLLAFGVSFDRRSGVIQATAQADTSTRIAGDRTREAASLEDSRLGVPTADRPRAPSPRPTVALAATALAETAQARTATAQQTILEVNALFAEARQAFRDEFVDNRNAWFTGVFREIETNTIEDGVFKVHWSDRGSSYELYAVEGLNNFIAEVACWVVTGGPDGSCGLVFGEQDGGRYELELFEDYYRLFLTSGAGEPRILAEGSPGAIVEPAAWNYLRAVRQGDRIRIFLNERLVADVRDRTYPGGKVGVATGSYRGDPDVEVHLDNFAVWELP